MKGSKLTTLLACLVVACVVSYKFVYKPYEKKKQIILNSKLSINVGLKSFPSSTDYIHELTFNNLILANLTHDPLLKWKGEDKFEPFLVKSWTQADKQTTVFKLREGIKFHTGRELTSLEVKETFDKIKKSQEYFILFESMDELKILGKYEFQVTTKKDFPTALMALSFVFPQDSSVENKLYSPKYSGTGPFIIKSINGVKSIKLTQNSKYWKKRKGNIRSINLFREDNGLDRFNKLVQGEYDIIYPIEPDNFEEITTDSKLSLSKDKNKSSMMLHLNQKANPSLQNAEIRKALDLAIDQQRLAKLVSPKTIGATQISPPEFLGHNSLINKRYNPSEAKRILQEQGVSNLTLKVAFPSDRYRKTTEVMQEMKKMLAVAGVNLTLAPYSHRQYWDVFYECSADMLMIGWYSDTNDSANFFEFLAMTPQTKKRLGKYNCGNFSSRSIDQLVLDSAMESDNNKRKRILQTVEKEIHDKTYILPLYWDINLYGYNEILEVDDNTTPLNVLRIADIIMDI